VLISRLFLATICLIIYGSLYPWHFHARELTANPAWILAHAWPTHFGASQIKDVIVNVLFYAPLGLFGFLSLSNNRLKSVAGAVIIAIGFALSCSMEMLQLFVAGRDTSALDVLSNTAGAAVGVACGVLFESYLRKIQAGLQTIRWNQKGSLLLLVCFAARELAPFFPDYSPYRVWHKGMALLAVNEFSVGAFLASLVEWLAVARLVETATAPPWVSRIYLMVLALIPAKILIIGRTTNRMELAGAALAYFIWRYGLQRSGWRSRSLAVLFTMLIVLRGLSPFHFINEATPFSWIPFRALLQTGRMAAFSIFFGKLFACGTLVWLLRDSGWRMRYAAAGAAAILAVIEAAQMYLPDRVPEVTDPLLALIVASVLTVVDGSPEGSPQGQPSKRVSTRQAGGPRHNTI
jgi:VanZ family protein